MEEEIMEATQQYQNMVMLFKYSLVFFVISVILRLLARRMSGAWIFDISSFTVGLIATIFMGAALIIPQTTMTFWEAFYLSAVNVFIVATVIRFLSMKLGI